MTQPLHAHHCWYTYGLDPWQYPLDAFRCLCRTCHSARPNVEHRLRALMAGYRRTELESLRLAMERLFYWYDRDVALQFLSTIGPDGHALKEAVAKLARFKTEPGGNTQLARDSHRTPAQRRLNR